MMDFGIKDDFEIKCLDVNISVLVEVKVSVLRKMISKNKLWFFLIYGII